MAWVALTIDCPDTTVQEKLRSFYAQALGGEVVEDCVRARGWLLIFDVVADYRPPTWPAEPTSSAKDGTPRIEQELPDQ